MLKQSDVYWRGYAFLDPSFRTFRYHDTFYKAQLPTAHKWTQGSGCTLLLQQLAQEGFIPETSPSSIQVEGFNTIFHQHTEFFNVPLSHCAAPTIKEAALLFLNMNKWLHKKNMGTCDGHSLNFVLQGPSNPRWCDIGSFAVLESPNQINGFDEFIQFFLYPLLLRQKSPFLDALMRHSLQNGISHEVATELHILDQNISLPASRIGILDALLELIQGISFPWKESLWSDYHSSMLNESDVNNTTISPHSPNRPQFIARILKMLKPATVVDLGANAGVFSRMAAQTGAEVLAIEPDETAVARHHQYLREYNVDARIKLQVGTVDTPFKQQGELVLALALTHHLFFTHHHPWKLIVRCFADFSSKHLLTEFMPNGLCGLKKLENPPPTYRLELFVEQLERYWEHVEILERPVPEGAANRILLLCTNKRAVPVDDGKNLLP
ncbi:MAG: hypothetical protein RRY29_08535 [Desulfovibrionaceae bacterium]